MVEADPDVPDAFAQELQHRVAGAAAFALELLRRAVRVEHGAARAAGVRQAQQAAVRGVDVGKQGVAHGQRPCPGRALQGQRQYGVGTIGVVVHELLTRRGRAGLPVGADHQMRQRVAGDVGMAGAHLAPGDLAVAVGVQPDGRVQVAQRNVPAGGELLALPVQSQVAVGRLVGLRRPAQAQRQRQQQGPVHPCTARHGRASTCAARACRTGHSKRDRRSQSSAGAAAAFWRAARADCSSTRASAASRCTA